MVSSSGGSAEPEDEPSGGPDAELAGALDRLRALCLALPEAT
ncbi:MAG: hypothetical protein QOC67_60, partial [Pseudonocardiales bacterium]|nr:hypothetical protein [Pseudonocardiales bacterium]